jgi:hypothetical protein
MAVSKAAVSSLILILSVGAISLILRRLHDLGHERLDRLDRSLRVVNDRPLETGGATNDGLQSLKNRLEAELHKEAELVKKLAAHDQILVMELAKEVRKGGELQAVLKQFIAGKSTQRHLQQELGQIHGQVSVPTLAEYLVEALR